LTLWFHCMWAADGLDAWTLRTNPVSNTNSLFSIAYAINRFVAVGGDPAPGWEGRGVILTSMDGRLWTQPRVSLGTLLHVTYGGGLFLAGPKAPGGIFNSRDGYSWASSLSGIRANGGVAYGNFMFWRLPEQTCTLRRMRSLGPALQSPGLNFLSEIWPLAMGNLWRRAERMGVALGLRQTAPRGVG
jgi:hypothetical protein